LIRRYSILQNLGRIVDIKVASRSDYGRVEKLELTGSTGKNHLIGAEEFRLALSSKKKPLRSSWYQLIDNGSTWRFENGKGWGHGVGMCQSGCQGMAQNGKSSVAILEYYYPRSILVRAY